MAVGHGKISKIKKLKAYIFPDYRLHCRKFSPFRLAWSNILVAETAITRSMVLYSEFTITPARTLSISGLKSRVLKLSFLSLKMMVKSGLEFILKSTEPLQSCCCPVQKYLPRMAELAWQLSRYL